MMRADGRRSARPGRAGRISFAPPVGRTPDASSLPAADGPGLPGPRGDASAGPDENDVYVLTEPEHTADEVAQAYAEIPPVTYRPPADRWAELPITASILGKGEGTLRVVMLGDSIVNDTSRSRWDDLLRASYPKCRIVRTTCVRGGTGCWWYKEPGRVKRYVLDHNPDLLDHRRDQPPRRRRRDPRRDPPGAPGPALRRIAHDGGLRAGGPARRPAVAIRRRSEGDRLPRPAEAAGRRGTRGVPGHDRLVGALHPRVGQGPRLVQARRDPRQHPGRAGHRPYPGGAPGAAGGPGR